jgi:hypothetical protein
MNTMFKKSIAYLLVLTLPISLFAQEQPATVVVQNCEKSRILGENAANSSHGTSGWFLGGVGSGVLLGLIGTGIIVGASAVSNPQPKYIPDQVDVQCYVNGYSKASKSKNIMSALVGGLAGTATAVLIILMSQSE